MTDSSRDLHEIPDAELASEVRRRAANRAQGLCPYCGAPLESPKCRYPAQHVKGLAQAQPAGTTDGRDP